MAIQSGQTPLKTRGIFADWGHPGENWQKELNELHATDVVFGINRDTAPFHLVLTEESLVDLTTQANAAGLRAHLMLWLLPDPAFIQASAQAVKSLLSKLPSVASVLFDVEKTWIHATPAPTGETVNLVLEAYADVRVPLGVTSYALLPENVRPLVARVSYGLPQAYSLYAPNGEARNISVPHMQEDAYRSWSQVNPRVYMGLAAYEQTGPGGVAETMQGAVNATAAHGVDAVFYWSLRASDAQSRSFITSLQST